MRMPEIRTSGVHLLELLKMHYIFRLVLSLVLYRHYIHQQVLPVVLIISLDLTSASLILPAKLATLYRLVLVNKAYIVHKVNIVYLAYLSQSLSSLFIVNTSFLDFSYHLLSTRSPVFSLCPHLSSIVI